MNERFEAARARGNEGLMLKRADSPYAPGRRGKWWLKLKRELSTLDVVVVAVEWGHGKRANVLSDYTFAVRGDDGTLQTIGKAYSGLTDVEIARAHAWFLQHRLPIASAREGARVRDSGRAENRALKSRSTSFRRAICTKAVFAALPAHRANPRRQASRARSTRSSACAKSIARC